MSDILLTHGYFLRDDEAEKKIMKPYPPLGILYLSAYLKKQGFGVDIFDSTFSSFEVFEKYISEKNPPIVGLYCNLMTKQTILRMMKVLRERGITVIVGGPEPPYHAEEFIQAGADYVVRGEGEETLSELLGVLSNGTLSRFEKVRGLVFINDDGRIIETPPRPFMHDLDSLPYPDREAIDIDSYIATWKKHHGMGSVSLITVRGCPFSCAWCSRSVYGETYRRRSPKLVADEVEFLMNRYKPDMLWIADDVFTINHRWLYELRDEFKSRNIRIPFECISRADRMNEEVIKALSDMGCFRVWFGSESGSQRILDAMNRGVTVEQIRSVTALTRKYGIRSGLFVMFGYDQETIDDIDATLDHLKKANPDIYLTTLAYPIKGTPYYNKVEKHIHTGLDWKDRSERDVVIRNRPSGLFYRFTTAWINNEMRLFQEASAPLSHRLRWLTKAKAARIGMKLTQ